jgi:flagellar motor switch protein FliG
MASSVEARAALSPTSLSGVEKVAVLLLALGKARAARLLKRFDPEDLKLLSHSVTDLRPISTGDLEGLVEEFGQKFSSGINFVGTATEIRSLLAGVMSEDEPPEAGPAADSRSEASVWAQVSRTKVDVLRAYLLNQHPQAVALILSRLDSEAAAKVISSFPPEYRARLLLRMLTIKPVPDVALAAVETRLEADLVASAAPALHTGIADILNRLEKSQSEAALQSLAEVRPDDAKALKSLLFTFDDLVVLPPAARTSVLDQVPIERLVLAMKGTDPGFQAAMLSALASRSRRMVEAALQSGGAAPARDPAEAPREIVNLVLKMIAKGEIEMQVADDLSEIAS